MPEAAAAAACLSDILDRAAAEHVDGRSRLSHTAHPLEIDCHGWILLSTGSGNTRGVNRHECADWVGRCPTVVLESIRKARIAELTAISSPMNKSLLRVSAIANHRTVRAVDRYRDWLHRADPAELRGLCARLLSASSWTEG
jgi:hypothetical protein